MIWVLRTGAPWRDLPAAYGPWQSVYTRWSRWSSSGVMASLLEALARDRDSESFLIDATVVRAHQDASGARKKGGPRDWAFSRRSVHEAACRGRCARQPRSPRVDPMPNPRDEACIRAARRHRERQCDRRSSLRCEAPRRAAGGARLHRNYPVEPNAGGATRESWRSQERALPRALRRARLARQRFTLLLQDIESRRNERGLIPQHAPERAKHDKSFGYPEHHWSRMQQQAGTHLQCVAPTVHRLTVAIPTPPHGSALVARKPTAVRVERDEVRRRANRARRHALPSVRALFQLRDFLAWA